MTNDKDNNKDDIKLEERMPDPWLGDNRWVFDIPDEVMRGRIDRFKDKTGFSDQQVSDILNGGEYKKLSDLPPDHEHYAYAAQLNLTKEDLFDMADRVARLALANDNTIDNIEILQEKLGFSTEQLAQILDGFAEFSRAATEELVSQIRTFELIKEKGELSNDDIVSHLAKVDRDLSFFGTEKMEKCIDELYAEHVKLTPEEERREDDMALEKISDGGILKVHKAPVVKFADYVKNRPPSDDRSR